MVDPTPTDDPLAAILPEAADRRCWSCTGSITAHDTAQRVTIYEHRATGRMLRLDARGRVYGADAEGVVRLFGRGGPMALAVVLNAVYDGVEELRPARVVLTAAAPVTS